MPDTNGSGGKSLGIGWLLFFGLFWSGITLGFDGFLAVNAYRQIRAQGYATTQGAVTHSQVERHAGRKGSTYSPKILYKYSVAGKEYTGDTYRYGQGSSNDKNADQLVAAHPIGKQVSVYYNTDDPADALLHPGLDGSDLFFSMFLLPFNLIMLGIWAEAAGRMWRSFVGPGAGGAKVWDDGLRVRVRLSQTGPVIIGAAVAGLLAFIGIFVVAFGFGGFHPPLAVMYVAWTVIGLGGLMGGAISAWKAAQGGSNLVIDTVAQTVVLPPTMGRTSEVEVPLRTVVAIDIERVERASSRKGTSYTYVPTLVFTDPGGAACRERLVEWWGEARAEELAAWLRDRLRIEPAKEEVG